MGAILEGKRACNENGGPEPTLIYSEASSSHSAYGWGGARNRSDRTSDYIKLEAALELVEAARWAIAAGVPFNRHLAVHWAMGGITDHDAAAATGRLIKLIGDWVRKRGGRFANAWVREMGRRKGSHVHILLHIPKGIRLDHMTRRWVRSILGQTMKGTIKTRAIGGTATATFSGSDWYEDNLAAVVAYLLKGVSLEAGEQLGLDLSAAGGRIIGKRVSISQNLRPAGRGWANPWANPIGQRLEPKFPASTVEQSTQGRGYEEPCNLQSGQRRETSVKTLTPIFSCSSRARAHARAKQEPGNQNFADDLGKSGEAA
jgi:hypothetical protein